MDSVLLCMCKFRSMLTTDCSQSVMRVVKPNDFKQSETQPCIPLIWDEGKMSTSWWYMMI